MEVEYRLAHARMELAQAIHGETYNQRGQCPNCGHHLTPREILAGFSQSSTDTTTQCPQCDARFQPILIAWGQGSSIEVSYYCPEQTLFALMGRVNLRPKELAKELPGVYQSAILHFGSLRAAFAEVGTRDGRVVEYAFSDIDGWELKVGPFLGQLPDREIARIVGVSPTTIRRMRKREGVDRYRASDYV